MFRFLLCLAAATLFTALASAQTAWQPVQGKLMTAWAAKVDPANPLPDYPRPQMVRSRWKSLNGLWEYAILAKDTASVAQYQGNILVPFCVESALSGVAKPVGKDNRLWYRRTFELPADWAGQRILLHFGAVDWQASVTVNGKTLGEHKGGYDPFTFDITDALQPSGLQEIVVAVWDPTEKGPQVCGKQRFENPDGIFYTAVTGIWQTVWLEPVPQAHIRSLKIVPDVDAGCANVLVVGEGLSPDCTVELASSAANSAARGKPSAAIALDCKNPRLWSPDSPFLYDLQVTLVDAQGKPLDRVDSYFGMRKIALARDSHGLQRLCLNGRPLFQFGPLDQGWWPDGLYTAPTDDALKYDLQVIKNIGFNTLRKHVKVEPDRLYYWCDKMGILVWQDMPATIFAGLVQPGQPDRTPAPDDAAQFRAELAAMIQNLYNHPSIVMWVPFNEGWSQHDTAAIASLVKTLDPSRLVNSVSGWQDRGAGDVNDLHAYPGPDAPKNEPARAVVLGEFGGLGLPLAGHTWRAQNEWGYVNYKNSGELANAYLGLTAKLKPLIHAGLSAAIYTQITDVEGEVNGLMTYDRAVLKIDQEQLRQANHSCVESLDK